MKALFGSNDDRYDSWEHERSTAPPMLCVWEANYPLPDTADRRPAVCPVCGGTGAMPQHIKDARHAAGLSPHMVEILCVACAGTGVVR